ncbi:hypothetical protein A7D00_7117 [Trichophyton violaceum]|uniref:Uncharacterized protein n=1 Tax=Trichophyton violaceum TaxID=34388 RepID=A0A178F8Z8_TRIVO|nr:hypothetical protein A7D00_7117 [Trichophyton violaceum]
MSYNKILKKVPIGSITKAGQEILLSVATETSTWTRPEYIAHQQGPGFKKAVEASKDLVPPGTKEFVKDRKTQHPSDDPRDHHTGVCLDDKGDGKSVHFPHKEE